MHSRGVQAEGARGSKLCFATGSIVLAALASACSGAESGAPDAAAEGPESVASTSSPLVGTPAAPWNGDRTFSEERPGGFTCSTANLANNASLVTSVRCDDNHCDNVTITCEEIPERIDASRRWTDWFSEETTFPTFCAPDEWVTGMACRNAYCDDMQLECSKITNFFWGHRYASGEAATTDLFTVYLGGKDWPSYAFANGLKCHDGWCGGLTLYGAIPARAGSFAQGDWDPAAIGDWYFGKFKATCPRHMAQIGLSIDQTGDRRGSKALCTAREDLPYNGDVLETKVITGGNQWADCGPTQFVAGTAQTTDGRIAGVRCVKLARASASCHDVSFANGDGRPAEPISDWDPGHFKGECAADEYMTAVSVDANQRANALRCCRM